MINNAHHRRSNQHLKKQGSKFTEEFKQLLEEVSEHEAFYRKQVESFQAMMAKNALKGASRNDNAELHNLNSPKANQQMNRELQLYSLQQKYESLKEEFSQQQIYYTQLLQLIASKDQWMSEQERKMANTLKSLQSPPTSPNRQPDFDSADQQISTINRLKEKCEQLTDQNISLKQQLDQLGKKKSIIQQNTSNSSSNTNFQKEIQIYQYQVAELNEQLKAQTDLNSKLNQTCQQLQEQINNDHSERQQLMLDIEGVYKEQIKLLQEELRLYKYDNGLKTIYEYIGNYLQEYQINPTNQKNDEVIRKLEFIDNEHESYFKQADYLSIELELDQLYFGQQITIKDQQIAQSRDQNLQLLQEIEELKQQQQKQDKQLEFNKTQIIDEHQLQDDNKITNINHGLYSYIQEELGQQEFVQVNVEKDQLIQQLQNTNSNLSLEIEQLKSQLAINIVSYENLTNSNFNSAQQYSIIQDMLDYETQIAYLQSQLQRFKSPSINNSDCGNMTAESNQTIETVGQKIQEAVDNLGIIYPIPEDESKRHFQQIKNLSNQSEQIFKADSSKSDQVAKTPQERQKLIKNITRTAIYSSEILNSKRDFTTLNSLAKDLSNIDSKQ